jgi:hypothetical protein
MLRLDLSVAYLDHARVHWGPSAVKAVHSDLSVAYLDPVSAHWGPWAVQAARWDLLAGGRVAVLLEERRRRLPAGASLQ